MEATSSLASVERMQEYTKLPQEPPIIQPNDPKQGSWPLLGTIDIRGLSLRHRPDLPLVLKDISMSVPSGAKVGIVGRTGAGKSSLLSAIFRLVEPESGSIVIDGKDIKNIGLTPLRGSALSLLPQMPFIFQGSLRENLDPFKEFSDRQIWEVLDDVQLRQKISQNEEGLYYKIQEGVTYFSVGEK